MRVLRLNHALRFSVEEGRPPCHQEALKSFKLFQAAHPLERRISVAHLNEQNIVSLSP